MEKVQYEDRQQDDPKMVYDYHSWTVPQSIAGMVIGATVMEKGGDWSNNSTKETEPFELSAAFELSNVQSYQDGNKMKPNMTKNMKKALPLLYLHLRQ